MENTYDTVIGGKIQGEKTGSDPKSFERRVEGRRTSRKSLASDKITSVAASALSNGSVNFALLNASRISVTVSATNTSGTATVTSGFLIMGYYPTAQDQRVKSIAISGTTLTVTLAAAATADNTFVVFCMAP